MHVIPETGAVDFVSMTELSKLSEKAIERLNTTCDSIKQWLLLLGVSVVWCNYACDYTHDY